MTAEIILFPTPARETTIGGAERLQRALTALDEAVNAQRAAVAEWRKALGNLGTTMHGLDTSLRHYRGNLSRLQDKVGGLNAQAIRLEQWADNALSNSEQE